MTTQTLEKEMLALERQFWDAIKSADGQTVAKLTADKCIVAGASGAMEIDRETMGQMLSAAGYELKDYRFDDFHVLPLRDGVVAVSYKVHEDMMVEGEPVSLDAYDTSVWVRNGGSWQCALHTESLAGDSFGRDRK
jgi:hypothetical protein